MENLKLRNYTDKDYQFLYETKKNAYINYVTEIWGWNEEVQKEIFDKFVTREKEKIYIIQKDDKNIGFYNYDIRENGDFDIQNICIIPEYQGKGIGTQILKDVLEKHKDKNIHIQYFKQNPVGNLYRRLGFIPNGETQTHYQMIKISSK